MTLMKCLCAADPISRLNKVDLLIDHIKFYGDIKILTFVLLTIPGYSLYKGFVLTVNLSQHYTVQSRKFEVLKPIGFISYYQ